MVKNNRNQAKREAKYKGRAQDLLVTLDRFVDIIKRRQKSDTTTTRSLTIHIWTTRPPSNNNSLLPYTIRDEVDASASWSKQRRSRSASFGAIEKNAASAARKWRRRSNSVTEKSNGKKNNMHPHRSNEVHFDKRSTLPLLCKSHFFTMKCTNTKKNGCRYLHYSPKFQTLNSVLNSNSSSTSLPKRELALSEAAASSTNEGISDHPGAMEMVYYLPLELSDQGTEGEKSCSDLVAEALSTNEISLSRILYVAIDNTLVFDRYRDVSAIAGFSRNQSEECVEDLAMNLPGPVLELILSFSENCTAVSAASRVCRAWYKEIGQNSPNLWRDLLQRQNWPLPEGSNICNARGLTTRDVYRNNFLKHYATVRDIAAIKMGLAALLSKKGVIEEKEMTYQRFSARQHAPSYPNFCVDVQVWSPNRILVAYNRDCSLRLFETTARDIGDKKVCREVICRRVDPYLNTKKRTCSLVSMGIDEDSIGCLCHVMTSSVDAEAFILVVISRDDFLLSDSSDIGGCFDHNVNDIGEIVLNYLLSCGESDHRLLQLFDFLSDGGDIGNVEVLISQSMAACGHGRFMIEASISIPVLDFDDGHFAMQLLDRRLFLFSSTAGAIVWMGYSNPLTHALRPRQEDMTLAYLRQPYVQGSRSVCCLAVGSSTSPSIMLGEIDAKGLFKETRLVEHSAERLLGALEGWVTDRPTHRVLAVTATDIVTADTMLLIVGGQVKERRSVLSFYPRHAVVGNLNKSMLLLPGNLEAIQIVEFRDQHILVICRAFTTVQSDVYDVEEEEGIGGLDGQWFAEEEENNDNTASPVSIYAVIIHVPSRHEIKRICLSEGVAKDALEEVPRFACVSNGTVAAALSWKGVVMAGKDIRSVGESQVTLPKKTRITRMRRRRNRSVSKETNREESGWGM